MPNINHIILSWARETAELQVENAAQKLQIKGSKTASGAEKLLAYENGTRSPSRSILVRMSKLYRRPLLTFYLDKPPIIGDRGEDFRTLPDDFEKEENAHVDMLIRDIKARQSLVRDTLSDEDEEIHLAFVGKNTVNQSTQTVTQSLREVLNLDLNEFRSQSNYGDAFKLLRQYAEEAGVFVLLQGNLGSHHTNISVTAFRGFVISDEIAPFILINDRDAKSAWSFTLLHEMVHIVLGQTGVSGDFMEKRIEKFCNEVASEFLLPSNEFQEFILSDTKFENVTEQINGYAFSKKISNSHIAYRLYRRGDIDRILWIRLRNFYHEQWIAYRDREKAKHKEKERGPSPYILRRYKLGALVGVVQRLTYSGAISTTKAGMLLNVRPLKVHRLFEANQPL